MKAFQLPHVERCYVRTGPDARQLDFMVLGPPRSGTAWASNWLTSGKALCVHEPLMRLHYTEWDQRLGRRDRMTGVACTGIARFPHFLRTHPARKLILHRPRAEVNESLAALGLPPLDSAYDHLGEIEGLHVPWGDLFDNPEPIYRYLLKQPMDWERHDLLCRLNVQADFEKLAPNPKVTQRLLRQMAGAA